MLSTFSKNVAILTRKRTFLETENQEVDKKYRNFRFERKKVSIENSENIFLR